jgi:hypothetical protein
MVATKNINISKEFLENELLKYNTKDIAKKLDITVQSINYHIKKHNIIRPVRTKLINRKFNKLYVIERVYKDGVRYMKCKCDCGNICFINPNSLYNNSPIVSCGCVSKSKRKYFGFGGIPDEAVKRVRDSARKRDLEYSITPEYMWEIFQKQNGRCVYTGYMLYFRHFDEFNGPQEQTASLDRIDSSLGYVVENVQWIYKNLQFMKSNMNESNFLQLISDIYANKIELKERFIF